jgi:hypothetical protein
MVGVMDIGLDGGRDGGGLFGALDLQPAPAPAPERPAAPRRRGPERRQVTLRAVSLDELVPAEHRVRPPTPSGVGCCADGSAACCG